MHRQEGPGSRERGIRGPEDGRTGVRLSHGRIERTDQSLRLYDGGAGGRGPFASCQDSEEAAWSWVLCLPGNGRR